MAKGTGLIGNFKGKVGNMVGYNLKDSNNKQTQGIRVYQPVVRNPKTYAQAEQRCIMKPINDFYRALKPIISRGYEGKAYGNASRLAWLKNVMKTFNGPWLVKGSAEQWPIACQVTAGSLPNLSIEEIQTSAIAISCDFVEAKSGLTIAEATAALLAHYSFLKEGDQITIAVVLGDEGEMSSSIISFVLSSTDTTQTDFLSAETSALMVTGFGGIQGVAVIVSREGANGTHLRSNTVFELITSIANNDVYKPAAKETAVRSYMSNGGNVDWPEESLTD